LPKLTSDHYDPVTGQLVQPGLSTPDAIDKLREHISAVRGLLKPGGVPTAPTGATSDQMRTMQGGTAALGAFGDQPAGMRGAAPTANNAPTAPGSISPTGAPVPGPGADMAHPQRYGLLRAMGMSHEAAAGSAASTGAPVPSQPIIPISPRSPPAAAPAALGAKRPVTVDQADYLRSINKFDPSVYQVVAPADQQQ
jgi:hypothetical protein